MPLERANTLKVSEEPLQRLFGLGRLEPGWAGTALVDDLAVPVDDVYPVRPARIRFLHGVVHTVEYDGNLQREVGGTLMGDLLSLLDRFGRRNNHALPLVLRHLPPVARVRLADVNYPEVRLRPMPFVHRVQRSARGAEGRSGIATEDQYRRALAEVARELERVLRLEQLECEVGRLVSDPQIALAPLVALSDADGDQSDQPNQSYRPHAWG